jgi:glutathione S-transferase
MFFTPASVEPAMAEKFMGLPPKVAAPWGTWDLVVETLEAALSDRQYMVLETFGAADVMMATTCRFLQQFQLVQPSPNMLAYMERCFSRPAYLRASARDS